MLHWRELDQMCGSKMGTYFMIFVLISVIAGIVMCDDASSDHIYKPCESNKDIECVKKFFSENGKCTVISKPEDNLLFKMNFPLYIPSINLTSVFLLTHVARIDADVKTLYVDKESNCIVMAVDFKMLPVHAHDAFFAINRKGREPKVFKDELNATYPVTLTAIINASDGITVDSLKGAEYFATLHENNANIVPGPNFMASEDPEISFVRDAFSSANDTIIKEIFQTKGSFDFLVYLQNYICDFGLAPVLEEYDTTALENAYNNDDDENNYIEPCAQEDDVTACVTNFFAEEGSCLPIFYPFGEPVFRSKAVFEVPKINSKVVAVDFQLVGLNGHIDNFYINNQTGNLVLSASFEAITMISPLTLLVINQMGKPPKVIGDNSSASYPVTLTAVVPLTEGLTAKTITKSYISAYVREPANINLGSKFTESTDPQMLSILQEVVYDPITITQELLASEGPNFFIEYLQKYVCDFQLPNAPF